MTKICDEAPAPTPLGGKSWPVNFDEFSDAFYLLDEDRRLVHGNRAFFTVFGLEPESAVGRRITEVMHPFGETEPCPLCDVDAARDKYPVIMEMDDPSNPTGAPIEIRQTRLRGESGEPAGTLLHIHDISAVRRAEERMRLFASVFQSTAQGVVITDLDGSIVEVNPAFTEMLGYQRDEVLGRTPRVWQSGYHDDAFYRRLWSSLRREGGWEGEVWNKTRSGAIRILWQTISTITDVNGNPAYYTSIYSDITQLKQSEKQLDHLAHHDSLTNLPNRLLLHERLVQAIERAARRGKQAAVVFIDIDNFKHINDSLGHPAGDRLLKELASRLSRAVRREDTLARIGGDEFVLVVEEIESPEAPALIADNITRALTEPILLEGHRFRATASMGISIYPRDGDAPETLLRNADAAMFRAKDRGRHTYCFYTEDLTDKAFERMQLENLLHNAVERDELHLVYQPQVELASGALVGLEALVRWEHAEIGSVSPDRFIPVADDSGLSLTIGRWILHSACQQGRQWLDQGFDFGRIAVNLAGPQIHEGNLVREVQTALSQSGLPASRLELEINETFVMQHIPQTIGQLSRLRQLGVSLSIDDFGTGYSSLRYLKDLPVNKLKLDRSFVRDIPSDLSSMTIAQTIIAMSRSLHLTAVAEGVESEAQARFLRRHDCQQAQGFLFGYPSGAAEIARLLSRR